MLVINSVLHFIIDGICAFMMLSKYSEGGQTAFVFYNLCAFALQMPFGALSDMVVLKISKNTVAVRRFYWIVSLLGVLFTIIGMYAGELSLGVGNALFHIGGGMSSIREDTDRGLKGRGLGIFVAPGALGLFVGSTLTNLYPLGLYIKNAWIGIALIAVLAGFLRLYYEEKHLTFVPVEKNGGRVEKGEKFSGIISSAVTCFVVVALRSFVGLSLSFSWKNGLLMGLIATLAVVLGKVFGGFLAAKIGELKAVVISLFLSSVCFVFSDISVLGILALFFFNMTMPITLYILIKKMPVFPGFSFGLLTFALFVGYMAVYEKITLPISSGMIGCAGSLVSLLLLSVLLIFGNRKKK